MEKNKYSLASKARWAKIEPAERSRLMSLLAKSKWAQLSPKQRKQHLQKMLKAKLNK